MSNLPRELKPCPFCGSNELHEYGDEYIKWIACDYCHSNSPCGDSPVCWNDRHAENILKSRIDGLTAENTAIKELLTEAVTEFRAAFKNQMIMFGVEDEELKRVNGLIARVKEVVLGKRGANE